MANVRIVIQYASIALLIAAGGWSLLAGTPALIWAMTLLVGALLALRTWPSPWLLAGLHGTCAAIATMLALRECSGCILSALPILAACAHLGLAVLVLWRPAAATYPILAVAGASVGMAVFAWTFRYLCGPCFAIHALAIAAGLTVLVRALMRAPWSVDRLVAALAVPLAGAALATCALARLPDIARNPDERRILAALGNLGVPVESLGRGTPAPEYAGIPIGDAQAPVHLEIVMAVGCSACVEELSRLRELAQAVMQQRLRLTIHIQAGTQVTYPEDQARAGIAALQEHPDQWLDILGKVAANDRSLAMQQSDTVLVRQPQLDAQLANSSRWAMAKGIVRTPALLLHRKGEPPALLSTLTPDTLSALTTRNHP